MFLYFNFLNCNEYLFYIIIVIIHHLIKMTQRTNNKHNNKILTWILYLLNSNICWIVIIFMAITSNFYIVVNKNYLYNYNEKITV